VRELVLVLVLVLWVDVAWGVSFGASGLWQLQF